MAQKVQVLFEDDIDGSEAEGTIRFSLDGTDYEIDLNEQHATELRTALAPFVEHARSVTPIRSGRAKRGSKQARTGPNTTEVREWAKAQGMEVKDRGRVPTDITTKFLAAVQ